MRPPRAKTPGRPAAWLVLALGPALAARAPAPLVVCCAGDSLMRPMPSYFRTLAPQEGLNLELREWAQGGLNTETYPSFFRRNLAEGEGRPCDAILLQLGTNDTVPLLEERTAPAEFRTRMTAILAEFKKFPGQNRPRPVLFLAAVPLFCARPESAAKNRIVETVVNPLIREIARTEGAVLVDQYAVLKDHPELYDPDCIHPNPAGEKALAQNWLNALRRVFSAGGLSSPPHPGAVHDFFRSAPQTRRTQKKS